VDTQLDLDRQALVLFRQLLELGTEDREALDLEIASLEAPLAERVRRLLEQHHVHTGRLERRLEQLRVGSDVPARLGSFTLLRELGRGGMGVVAEGQREAEGFTQRVAIKWIPAWQVDAARRQRFLFERDVVSRLRHPNIAQLVDGGEGEQGELWYAMELVEGEDLLEHCRERRLDLRARVGLLLDLCSAVSYAHRNLILHRDIKPSNVLVDREGQLKLIDFGIAKGLDDAAEGLTQDSAPMTPRYAAPEQLRGERPTTATDVWQVAALGFELLTGVPARKGDALRRASIAAMQASADHSANCGLDFKRLHLALRGDLDAILAKALHEAPEQRYANSESLMSDLSAWLDGQPVAVRKHERWYAAGRFVHRHAGALAIGITAVALVVASTYMTFQQDRHAREQSRIAEASTDLLLQVMLSTPGGNMTNLTLRGYFDHVIETTLQDSALPPAQRYRVLAGMVERSGDLGVSPASERGARALISLAEQVYGKESMQAAFASDQWVAVALSLEPGRAGELQQHTERTAAFFAHPAARTGREYLEHLKTRATLANALRDAGGLAALAEEMYALAEGIDQLSLDTRIGYMGLLPSAYAAGGRWADASAVADRTLNFAETASTHSLEAASTLDHLRAVACEMRAASDPASAVELCQGFVRSMRASKTLMSQAGATVLRGLGAALTAEGNHLGALSSLREADEALVQVHGTEAMSMLRLRVLNSIGVASARLGQHEEAYEVRKRQFGWLTRARRDNRMDILRTRIELAESMIATERNEELRTLMNAQADLSGLPESWRARWDAVVAHLDN